MIEEVSGKGVGFASGEGGADEDEVGWKSHCR